METGARRPVQLNGTWQNWKQHFARDGDPDGPLFGETIVFTGTLSMPRAEAASLAAKAGCKVADSVTKKTTLLVVGDQDIRTLAAGHEKSGKHEKAERLIAGGQAMRILTESDFKHLIHLDSEPAQRFSPENKNACATNTLDN